MNKNLESLINQLANLDRGYFETYEEAKENLWEDSYECVISDAIRGTEVTLEDIEEFGMHEFKKEIESKLYELYEVA